MQKQNDRTARPWIQTLLVLMRLIRITAASSCCLPDGWLLDICRGNGTGRFCQTEVAVKCEVNASTTGSVCIHGIADDNSRLRFGRVKLHEGSFMNLSNHGSFWSRSTKMAERASLTSNAAHVGLNLLEQKEESKLKISQASIYCDAQSAYNCIDLNLGKGASFSFTSGISTASQLPEMKPWQVGRASKIVLKANAQLTISVAEATYCNISQEVKGTGPCKFWMRNALTIAEGVRVTIAVCDMGPEGYVFPGVATVAQSCLVDLDTHNFHNSLC